MTIPARMGSSAFSRESLPKETPANPRVGRPCGFSHGIQHRDRDWDRGPSGSSLSLHPSPIPLSRPGHKFPGFFHPGATAAINSRSWPFPADSSLNPSKSRLGARNERRGPGGIGARKIHPPWVSGGLGVFPNFSRAPGLVARAGGGSKSREWDFWDGWNRRLPGGRGWIRP